MCLTLIEDIKDFFGQFGKAMASFRFADLLDILLVAFIVYSAIKLIRETRAVQLLKGLLILGVLYLVARWVQMEAISFILSKLFGVAIIALIILFQPELRHALESVGRSNFTNLGIFGVRNDERVKTMERVRKAIIAVSRECAEMSERRVGALIVFEKETLLGEIIKTGTPVNADITTELIGNIFYPKAPLHDGAMVIRDGRMVAAGCILPLTSNNLISSALGTRHRAALGISEQCDAMVVVVSEETGAISLARKGILNRDITSAELRQKLTDYLIGGWDQMQEQSFFERIRGRLKK